MLRVITYNVYGGGKWRSERTEHISKVFAKDASKPADIVCLQEATDDIIGLVVQTLNDIARRTEPTASKYQVWTKLDALLENPDMFPQCTEEEVSAMKSAGYMAIISRFPIKKREVIHAGSWLDDGILRCLLDVSEVAAGHPAELAVYNVHLIGGTYEKPQDVVLKKREKRKAECMMLNDSLSEYGNCSSREIRTALVCGDFNSDANDPELFPETKLLPEHIFPEDCIDCWSQTRPEELGATESHENNAFRAWLKPGQKREARFDRVFLYCRGGRDTCASANALGAMVLDSELCGTEQVGTMATVDFKGEQSEPVPIFPSDHFGVQVQLRLGS